MSLRRKLTLAIFGLLTIGLIAALAVPKAFDVRLSEETVQAAIDKALPFDGSKVGIDYSVSKATASLREDGRIAMTVDVTGKALHSEIAATMTGSGKIIYRDGSFYLAEFEAEGINVTSTTVSDQDRTMAVGAAKAVANRLKLKPETQKMIAEKAKAVATGAPGDEGDAMTKTMTTLRDKAKDGAVATVRHVLDSHPVYTLKETDIKQQFARLAISTVSVEKDTLVVTISPWDAVAKIVGYGLIAILAAFMAVGLVVTSPEVAFVYAIFG
jgi:hypothetical protein